MKFSARTYLTACILSVSTIVAAQSVNSLKQQREKTLKQLQNTTQMLKETKQNEKATLNKLNLIGQSISERRRLIDGISQEVLALDRQNDSLQAQINQLQAEQRRVKADYKRLVLEQQEGRKRTNWMQFVFAADDFNQMMRRAGYMTQMTEYRKVQAHRIQEIADTLARKQEAVRQNRNGKQEIMQLQQREQDNLERDQRKHQSMLNSLKTKEKDLTAKQKQQQKKANDLNARIERMIAEEIRKAEEAKRKANAQKSGGGKTSQPTTKPGGSTTKPKESVNTLTKEEALLAGNFEKNKGRLPWPVLKGFVSGTFGEQPHAQLSHVTVNNKGILIQTPQGTMARAVFEGVVTQCFSVPGANNIVIIQHGNYRTVYANLTTISVKAGQKVTAKQNIGKIYSDPDDDNKTELNFQLWKDKTPLNPALWLAK
ncbi:MAG: peptidoglycan DD-metalloendopeptidase family protein [Paludibacteraceae bacterium]|nr:peptidoglycan DD-metalloendopeptidase family protein [Paludibacteraceae bacterium]